VVKHRPSGFSEWKVDQFVLKSDRSQTAGYRQVIRFDYALCSLKCRAIGSEGIGDRHKLVWVNCMFTAKSNGSGKKGFAIDTVSVFDVGVRTIVRGIKTNLHRGVDELAHAENEGWVWCCHSLLCGNPQLQAKVACAKAQGTYSATRASDGAAVSDTRHGLYGHDEPDRTYG
jgi:hypothetical protein